MEAEKEPTPMKKLLPSQTMEKEFLALAGQRAPLSDAVRLAAQLMLQKAVEVEVSDFLGRGHYERSGPEAEGRGYRNGYEPKGVQTAEGTLRLKMPQVRETLEAFESVWVKTLVSRSDKLVAASPNDGGVRTHRSALDRGKGGHSPDRRIMWPGGPAA